MLGKLVASALFAGLAAGLIVAALRIILVVPVILEAELYETGTRTHYAGLEHQHDAAAADDHDHAVTAADEGNVLSRNLLTVLATVAAQIGFALLMVAGFSLAGNAGYPVSPRAGLIWGLCGFAAVQLLPAAGLPPELPGAASAALQSRQIWWTAAVALSVAGLGLIAFGKGWSYWLAGIMALALPHLIGAPQPVEYAGVVPPELTGDFIGKTMVVNAVGWALLGLFTAWFWNRETARS